VSKIEIGRFSELLRRMLGQKGQEEVAGELSPEISPTIQIEGPSAEWDFLKGVRRCGNGTRLAAAAGFSTRFRIRNPSNSGVLGVVDLIATFSQTDGVRLTAGILPTTVDLPLPSESASMDRRWEVTGANQTALIMSADNTVVTPPGGQIFMRARTITNREVIYNQQIVLPPGVAVEWGIIDFNVGVSTYLAWRERGIPLLEL